MSDIVILNGSPRVGGNTDLLVSSFVEGLDDGDTVETIRVAELSIHQCIGCNACYAEGNRCRWDDDMTEVYARMAEADVIVIATPVYFFMPSAQLKTVIDRLHNPIRNGFRVKRLVLLAVAAQSDPAVFDSLTTMYRQTLGFFGLEDAGSVLVGGVVAKGDIAGRRELREAKELASRIS